MLDGGADIRYVGPSQESISAFRTCRDLAKLGGPPTRSTFAEVLPRLTAAVVMGRFFRHVRHPAYPRW